jgi:hypothetical protein
MVLQLFTIMEDSVAKCGLYYMKCVFLNFAPMNPVAG